jgi:tRNA threonylcarbamoyladenosine modification (KEOPS) complex  Pcc1 subunit
LTEKNNLSDNSQTDFYSELIIKAVDPKKIIAAYEAIKPETSVIISQRGKTNIFLLDDETLKMEFFAADFVSLRAMLGSYLRWLETIFDSLKYLEDK